MQSLSSRKRLLIAGVFAVIGVLLLMFTSRVLRQDAVQQPASNFIKSDAPATFLESDDLYASVEPNQFSQLREDATTYAREHKKVEDQSVTYKVSRVSVNDAIVEFQLVSQNTPAHIINVTLEKLANQRQKLSFQDAETKDTEFDSSLASNSKVNMFISTLPINEREYAVEYDPVGDRVVIVLYERSEATKNAAVSRVNDAVAPETLSPGEYDLIVPGIFEGQALQNDNEIEGD